MGSMPPHQSGPGKSIPPRPLFTFEDLAWIAYYYPVRWAARILGDRFFVNLRPFVERLYQFARRGQRQVVARRMVRLLGIPQKEADTLSRGYVRNSLLASLFNLWIYTGQRGSRYWTTRILGLTHLQQELEAGRGVLLVAAHTFAKQQTMFVLREKGYEVVTIYGEPFSNAHGRLMRNSIKRRTEWLQQRIGYQRAAPSDPNTILRVAQHLRRGGIVATASDVAGSVEPVEIPFLKGSRTFANGAADVARLTGCSVIPLISTYREGEHLIEFGKPLVMATEGPREEVRDANLRKLGTAFEAQVQRDPDQWEGWIWRNFD